MTFKPDWKKPPKEKKPKKFLKRTYIKKHRKTTGELRVFIEIWSERAHYCQICGEPLKYFNIDCFSHLLPKKTYTKYKKEKKNIWLMCCNRKDKCHDKWHNAYEGMSSEEMWKQVFAEYQKLKTEYNQLYLK